MNIRLLDVVALTGDIPEYNLRRGQVGTVVEILANGNAFEVEFSDLDGRTYESVGLSPDQITLEESEHPLEIEEYLPGFSPGQIVTLKSDPTMKGAVVEVLPGQPENRVKVFAGGTIQSYYASQLKVEAHRDEVQFLALDQFHAYLTALQIRHPSLSTLYSLNAARVDFIPYQFRPVLRFIRSDRPRLLIADGVGVGKTIEAGLILRELQARRDIRSVLIICPRPLVTERKWESEMKRFEERFIPLNGPTLRYCINELDLEGVWPDQHQKVILPYSLFDDALLYGSGTEGKRRPRKGLLDLDPPPRFDLVIVDEAHHIRNQETYAHKAVRFFCDHAEAAVFLTATPIQLGSHDLFVLLNTLRPDLILDQESFEHMAEPNPFISQAVNHARALEPDWSARASEALNKAASTDWGRAILSHSPEFNRIRGRVLALGQSNQQDAESSVASQKILREVPRPWNASATQSSANDDERIQLITDIEALHTFSGIINRTRRRDIGEFTIRKPETVAVEFTGGQKRLHDALLQVQAEIFSQLHSDISVNFMMTTIRRQAASCLFGLAPFLKNILNRHIDELEWTEADNTAPVLRSDAVDSIQLKIQAVLEQARSLDPSDPKYERLHNIIREKQSLPNNKVMLFSSFRHTLHYLYERLAADGLRVGMLHGGTPDDERLALRNRFAMPREDSNTLDILLFSEIGCEGLDYQFCDCIVNYDLPWNPMRVEQRIGRIDRVGQKSETVAIVNLITPGTVDADIYERCLKRIGVFESALGGSEEILGDITKEIRNIAENYTLSEEERGVKLQQLADNRIRLVQEQAALEQKQMELFGIRLPEDRMMKDIEEASSFWLHSASIHRLVRYYLQQACGGNQEFILGERPLKTLRLSQDARTILLRDFQNLPRQNAIAYREWENWLKGADQHLSMTFESDCATEHPEAAFIMPLHPLVKQAATALLSDMDRKAVAKLKVRANEVPAGRYEFVIYQWQFHGIREDLALKPIASSDAATPHLDRLLEKAADVAPDEQGDSARPVWDELEAQHYQLWSAARAEHQQRTQELAAYRRESLSTSHKARLGLLNEQLEQASDDKIRRMRRSQIDSAEADYDRRIQELDRAIERADVVHEPVAYGVLIVEEIQ